MWSLQGQHLPYVVNGTLHITCNVTFISKVSSVEVNIILKATRIEKVLSSGRTPLVTLLVFTGMYNRREL